MKMERAVAGRKFGGVRGRGLLPAKKRQGCLVWLPHQCKEVHCGYELEIARVYRAPRFLPQTPKHLCHSSGRTAIWIWVRTKVEVKLSILESVQIARNTPWLFCLLLRCCFKNVLVNMSTSYSGVSQVAKEWPFVFNADQKAMGTHGKNEAIIARVADLECPVCDRDATFTAALA